MGGQSGLVHHRRRRNICCVAHALCREFLRALPRHVSGLGHADRKAGRLQISQQDRGTPVAQHLGLPSAIVEPGILLFLLLPAIVIAGLLLAFPRPAFEGALLTGLAREREGEIR